MLNVFNRIEKSRSISEQLLCNSGVFENALWPELLDEMQNAFDIVEIFDLKVKILECLDNVRGPLSLGFLYYGVNSSASIDGKVCAIEITRIATLVLESQFSIALKIGLFISMNAIGYLVDRGSESSYVCEHAFNKFYKKLESFYLNLNPKDQEIWTRFVFNQNPDQIEILKHNLKTACKETRITPELKFIRGFNVNRILGQFPSSRL